LAEVVQECQLIATADLVHLENQQTLINVTKYGIFVRFSSLTCHRIMEKMEFSGAAPHYVFLLTDTEKTCETSLSRLLRQLTRLPVKRKRIIINYRITRHPPLSLKHSQMGLSLFSSTRPQPVQRVLKRDPCSSTTCSEPTTKTIFISRATRQMRAIMQNSDNVFLPTCTFVKLVDILSYHHDPPAHTSLQKWQILTGRQGLLFEPGVHVVRKSKSLSTFAKYGSSNSTIFFFDWNDSFKIMNLS
jgi:hypothetical protein